MYEEIVTVTTNAITICGLIALLVSVLTEFWLKKVFVMEEVDLNRAVTLMSLGCTIMVGGVYSSACMTSTPWYYWVGVVIMGFITACIAMSGYDKVLSYVYQWINNIFDKGE